MPLFLPSDPPDSLKDSDWSQPLKKAQPAPDGQVGSQPTKPAYQKTGTPGVVVNVGTGKMETQIPLPKSYFPSNTDIFAYVHW